MITLALLLIRVTQNWPSNRLLRTTQVDIQLWNTHTLIIFWLKNLTDLVRMHPALNPIGPIKVDMIPFRDVVETTVARFTDDFRN